jgi:hypothetical protein
MQVTRLLPANRTSRLRLENNRRVLTEIAAKASPTALDVKRRKNATFVIETFNRTGKVI